MAAFPAELTVVDGTALTIDPPDRHAEPGRLAEAMGEGLRRLHVRPVPEPRPGGAGWPGLFAACRHRVESGVVEAAVLPPPYDRHRPDRLLALVADGRPAAEDEVWCHGRPTARSVWVLDGRFAGFSPPRPGESTIADRHLDLAVAHLSVHEVLGPEAVFAFYDAYGRDADLVRLDHYLLIAHLLGRTVTGEDERPEPAPSTQDHPGAVS